MISGLAVYNFKDTHNSRLVTTTYTGVDPE